LFKHGAEHPHSQRAHPSEQADFQVSDKYARIFPGLFGTRSWIRIEVKQRFGGGFEGNEEIGKRKQ